MRATIERLGLLQLDSVNVFERSHYLPLLARLGPYRRAELDRLLQHREPVRMPRRGTAYTEYWAHAACVLPVKDIPLWQWRMQEFVARVSHRRFYHENGDLLRDLRRTFDDGPLSVSQIEHPGNVRLGGGWWNHNLVRRAVDLLFCEGELLPVGRIRFERRYCRTAEVAAAAGVPLLDGSPARRAAVRELVRRACVSLGIATADDIADYYRLSRADTEAALTGLVGRGEVEQVSVDGWAAPAYLHAGARFPRTVRAQALLSPFDPVCWYRPRAERLFGFRYRIEIYVPAAKRRYGYYVLPVLMDDSLVGRVDLKSDRDTRTLQVRSAWIEPGQEARRSELTPRLAQLLRQAADWQGLARVSVHNHGTWAGDLSAVLASGRN